MNYTLADVVVIMGALMSLFSFVKVITSPLSRIEKTERDVASIKADLDSRKKIDRAILNSLQAIINHMIDGNGTPELTASRKELQSTINEVATK